MPTRVEEKHPLGEEIGRKAAAGTGPTRIMIPLTGMPAIYQTGKAFDDPAARLALYDGIRSAHGSVERIAFDKHFNDAAFAEMASQKLLDLIRTWYDAQQYPIGDGRATESQRND